MTSIELPVIYENDDLAILNKPAGLVMNRAETTSEATLQDWLADQVAQHGWGSQPADEWSALVPTNFQAEFGTPEEIFAQRLGLVHRLDKDTSGVVVIAKNPGALVNLLSQFKLRQVQKKYLALCHGKFLVSQDTLRFPLGRAQHNRLQFAVTPDGRAAETEYQVQRFYPGIDVAAVMELPAAKGSNFRKKAKLYQGFSLVECLPHTGRTHQIRVHLSHIKHPLVGDKVYVGKKRSQLDAIWCSRHFLHASQLQIKDPRTGDNQIFQAELPSDLQAALEVLRTE